MKRLARFSFIFLVSLWLFLNQALAIRWPFDPGNVPLPLGNSYGEYQNYGGSPYFHPGIDIFQPAETPVFAVKSGIVKAVLTTSAELHWRVAVGDSAGISPCDGWLYAHLDRNTIQVQVGDTVQEGDWLGNLVYWPISNFHHCHFVKIRNSGMPWQSNWQFIANPLDELIPNTDATAPVIENALGSNKFAFCQNNTHTYFSSGQSLFGDVDIIAKIYDKIGDPYWRLTPHKIEYSISKDDMLYGPVLFLIFTDTLFWSQNVGVVYQNDATCNTQGDYDYRNFYFIVTNTNGDGIVQSSDASYSWKTADFPNGNYWAKVKAYDQYGNSDEDSMQVQVYNTFAFSGKIFLSDIPFDLSGSIITVLEAGKSDTTDPAGNFSFALGNDSYNLQITHPGYTEKDTTISFQGNLNLNFTLNPAPFVLGDVNKDGIIDIGDIVFLINFVFYSGFSPIPYSCGDVNKDGIVDIGDIVYLINYVFYGGPPPLNS
jgi:hypothetical protein